LVSAYSRGSRMLVLLGLEVAWAGVEVGLVDGAYARGFRL
jgi:hypothetical protein